MSAVKEKKNKANSLRASRPIGIDLFAGAGGLSLGTSTPLFQVPSNPKLEVPQVTPTSTPVSVSSIQYVKPRSEIAKVKKLLRNSSMPNYRVGELTFEYFLKNESED